MGNFVPAGSRKKTSTPIIVKCCHQRGRVLTCFFWLCESTADKPVSFFMTYITTFPFQRHRCYGWCGVSVS